MSRILFKPSTHIKIMELVHADWLAKPQIFKAGKK